MSIQIIIATYHHMKSNNNHNDQFNKQAYTAIKHIINQQTIHHMKLTNLQFKIYSNKCNVNEINLFHEKMLVVSVKIHLPLVLLPKSNCVSQI